MPSVWGWTSSAWGWDTDDDDFTSQVTERLSAEFATVADADTVAMIVRRARRSLDAAGTSASPAAVEELARRRLQDATGSYTMSGVVEYGPAAGSSVHVVLRYLHE